jgi:hypothetical protein
MFLSELAEIQASDSTALAGHVFRAMMEPYSHTGMKQRRPRSTDCTQFFISEKGKRA